MLIDMADMLLDDEKALSALMEVCYPKSDLCIGAITSCGRSRYCQIRKGTMPTLFPWN